MICPQCNREWYGMPVRGVCRACYQRLWRSGARVELPADHLTAVEAARLCGVSRSAMSRWCRHAGLDAHNLTRDDLPRLKAAGEAIRQRRAHGRGGHTTRPVTCGHTDRPHHGRGMCEQCYMHIYWTRGRKQGSTVVDVARLLKAGKLTIVEIIDDLGIARPADSRCWRLSTDDVARIRAVLTERREQQRRRAQELAERAVERAREKRIEREARLAAAVAQRHIQEQARQAREQARRAAAPPPKPQPAPAQPQRPQRPPRRDPFPRGAPLPPPESAAVCEQCVRLFLPDYLAAHIAREHGGL